MHLRPIVSSLIISLLICFLNACKQQNENTAVEQKVSNLPTADSNNGGLSLPDDFGAVVVADSTGRARHIAVNDNGDVFIKLRRLANEVGVLTVSDTSNDGKMDTHAGFGAYTGTGIHIYNGFL